MQLMNTPSVSIEERLARLERRELRRRATLLSLLVITSALVCLGHAAPQLTTLEANKIVLKDVLGRSRVVLEAGLTHPSIRILGLTLNDQTVLTDEGVTLNDPHGNPRIELLTFSVRERPANSSRFPSLTFTSDKGLPMASLSEGSARVFASNGRASVILGGGDMGPVLLLADTEGNVKARLDGSAERSTLVLYGSKEKVIYSAP